MTKEHQIWELAQKVLGIHGEDGRALLYGFDIHYYCDDYEETVKMYHKDGYCIDLQKDVICEPDEIEDYSVDGLETDGCVYQYSESWDGFNECGINKAIALLNAEL